ncbi:STAS domain-containing protein, partial [Candidatus Dependentiae bacterium]|nr:STAS domain-containing protein [Candidatus Dependentiae bacterium]
LIGTGSVKRSNYLLLDKIYNDENEIKLFKKQLINLLNFGFSGIRIDAKELEYMDSLCADFLKRFIDLCASYKIKLKIFNAKKTVEDFLTRKNIPENIFY